jgi:hypothetical protein
MKNFFLSLFIVFTVASFTVCCDQDNSATQENAANLTANKWYIFYVTWEEWGRASRNCAGWGLCNFYSCWTCEIADRPGQYSGKVIYNDETGRGTLSIELNQTEEIQTEAITWELPFTIDKDIVNGKVTLLKGIYKFDSKVGPYGGYLVDVLVN